jgi:hypothetical protein
LSIAILPYSTKRCAIGTNGFIDPGARDVTRKRVERAFSKRKAKQA